MPFGAILSEGSSGESVSHFGAIRVRVYGTGQLLMSAFSNDDVKYKTMVPFKMAKLNRITPTRIVNFVEQRASFELKVTNPNEFFRIQRIIIFSKVSATSYPGS
jgi:hypothetical protein